MKRRLVLIGMAVAICISLFAPASALAHSHHDDFEDDIEEQLEDDIEERLEEEGDGEGPLNAQGIITRISEGDVRPASRSGWWIVRSREVYGTLEGDLEGDFVLTYKARVDDTQAGKFSGRLNLNDGETIIKVKGRSQPFDLIWFEQYGVYLPLLTIGGDWEIKGDDAEGTFQAWFLFVPIFDEQGNMHIGQIVDSTIVMTGEWD